MQETGVCLSVLFCEVQIIFFDFIEDHNFTWMSQAPLMHAPEKFKLQSSILAPHKKLTMHQYYKNILFLQ